MADAAQLAFPDTIRVVDSHTEGEPTRVILQGWPAPRGATMAERRDDLRARFDHLRGGVVCEPRGHDAMVAALLTAPVERGSTAGVIYFNNTGYLGMCGHGTIGVIATLAYLGRIGSGMVRLDTPVGTVSGRLEEDGAIAIRNVPARCYALDVAVEVAGAGTFTGDIAWGGNWFFITSVAEPALELHNAAELTELASRIMAALRAAGITGADGAPIDHVELSGAAVCPDADARNFVLCPGGAYDRSPCGTGTSAKMAALHARGALAPGQQWRQEGITGGLFTGWLEEDGAGAIVPHLRGRALITAEATLRFDPRDPFRAGFTAAS